ncbi:MAG TPA: hypothetical protein VLE97_09935 [Gaiellaceae bacterium]|nr:hypothetical protein [Gaiellaceae bacterium]
MQTPANERGAYGAAKAPEQHSVGAGGILLLVGITAGIYALSPGARHFFRHGYLPPARRER